MSSATLSPPPQTDVPLLRLRGISKTFGAVSALTDIDLDVSAGEVVALVGDNGAGKSTLVKAIAGIYPLDTGTYVFQGDPVTVHGPNDVSALGVEVVYQDLALCDNLDIVSNMFLGRELKRHGALDEAKMESLAREALSSLSVRTVKSVRQPVSSLSGGQRQTVAIAKSVLWNAKVVLLDEPTAALGVAQTRQVLDLVRRLDVLVGEELAQHGQGCLHPADDALPGSLPGLLEDLGRVAAEVKAAEVSHSQVVELITAGRSGSLGLAPAEAAQSM